MVTWLETSGAELIHLATERRQHTHRLLGTHLAAVTDLISESRYTRPVEQRLHTLAAALSQAIAWQHFDRRRHISAGRFWHAALHNAHAADQRDLGAGVLSDLAYQLLRLQDARTAADMLEYAIPRTRHPTARSLLHLRQARALADLGRTAGAAARSPPRRRPWAPRRTTPHPLGARGCRPPTSRPTAGVAVTAARTSPGCGPISANTAARVLRSTRTSAAET
ncbi:hypothetical protein [Streptomyces filamentosus]|uniref:hypothetical protein n=1 Tax=Streptomyces filamentosus TaxID=67294 RepID=UPI0033DC91B7